VPCNYPGMTFYRRRLPHFYEIDQPVFLTWRLHDSLPPNRPFPTDMLNSGQAFAALDRLLDEACNGAVLPPPASHREHDRGSHALQRQCPRALSSACLRRYAKSRSSAGFSRRTIGQTDEIVERHHGQAGQRNAGFDGKPLLAGRELRPPGAAYAGIREDPELH